MFRNQKGFTLIELMIVVVIIGILAAIAIPNFIAMQNRAKEGSTKANMHTLQLAAEDYGVQSDGVYARTMVAGSGIGVDPAWLSKPEILPSYQSTPWPESTTPMVLPSASRIGPCSMCNSTKQPSFWKPTGLSPR